MNQIVGGGPQARLFLDLREEHSLTYGAYSRFTADIYPGDWQASSPVRTKVTKDAMDAVHLRIQKDQQRSRAAEPNSTTRIAPSSPASRFRSSSPREIISDWLTVQYYGLPADYWDKYPDQIFAVGAPACSPRRRSSWTSITCSGFASVIERPSKAI